MVKTSDGESLSTTKGTGDSIIKISDLRSNRIMILMIILFGGCQTGKAADYGREYSEFESPNHWSVSLLIYCALLSMIDIQYGMINRI